MAFIATWAQNKAAEYLKTGIQAGGTLAGNAVGGVGGLVESSGQSFGEGTVNGSVRGVGNYINGYGDSIKGVTAADGPVRTAKKTPIKSAVPKTASMQKPASTSAQTSLSAGSRKAVSGPQRTTKAQKAITSKQIAVPKHKIPGSADRKASIAPKNTSKPTITKAMPLRASKAPNTPTPRIHSNTNPASGRKKMVSVSNQSKALH